jgi:c-type cytochrome biogenesis protein CcmF
MLMLLAITSVYSFFFVYFDRIDNLRKIIVSSSQSLIIAQIAAFIAFASNPFERIFPTPTTGLGLNPLLQDVGLALHPPMLYSGYIGLSVVFSLAISSLISLKLDRELAKSMRLWLSVSFGFLTLGVALGSWWAYRELGWGGFWFWDPVENISLMPWLGACALIHAVMMLEKKGAFKTWTIILSIVVFILCLFGIFLVRSGLMSSVHSFAVDAKRGFFIIAIIFFTGGAALTLFASRFYKIVKICHQGDDFIFIPTKNSGLFFIVMNNYLLAIGLFTVFFASLSPIISQSFFDKSISVGPEYYNRIFGILIIPFLGFLSLSYFFSKKNLLQGALILLVSSLVTLLVFKIKNDSGFFGIIIFFLAIIAILFVLCSHINPSLKALPSSLAHIGFCLTIVGIIISSYFGDTREINIRQGETMKIKNYEIEFLSTDDKAEKNFLVREGTFLVSKNGAKPYRLKPELRYYPVSNQITNESAIKYEIFSDIYLVLGNKDESNFYALRVYYKPFIHLIWLGSAMIVFGVFLLGLTQFRAFLALFCIFNK